MGSRYHLVVFDWEGTIGDPLGQFLSALAIQAKLLKLDPADEETARYYIAMGPVVALKKMFPHLSAAQQAELLQNTQQTMLLNHTDVCLISGAREILLQIKKNGIKLAIATNKGQQSLLRDLTNAGLQDLFDVTRTASQASAKPSPQMLEEIIAECGVTADETLMVGDSVSDIEMATQLRVTAIGVDFYGQNEAILRAAGAEDVFDNFQKLSCYLELMDCK